MGGLDLRLAGQAVDENALNAVKAGQCGDQDQGDGHHQRDGTELFVRLGVVHHGKKHVGCVLQQ